MRDNVEAFVSPGGHVANFSGNTAWWQIRYAAGGSAIVGYKNVLEDPLLGSDDSQVTCNWSTDPPNRPENTLTGLSFRYGWPFTGTVTRVPFPPAEAAPIWVGVSDPTNLADLEGEADGIEMDFSDPLHPHPTFRDGTPDTFVVLAYKPPISTDGPTGCIAIGYYTNVGTVFSCPATNWINLFGDADVDAVTFNALTWLLGRGRAAAMSASRAIVPPSDWTTVDTGGFGADEILARNTAAFLYAGASGVVAPLWSIEDAIAKEIALRFYEQTFAGMAPAEFLHGERCKFRDTSSDISATCIAYHFFGHPAMRLIR
jgi:hypothetical protein